nr:unnamed protein product [Callosobruchus analis]
MLNILNNIGLSYSAVQLFDRYFRDRMQLVNVADKKVLILTSAFRGSTRVYFSSTAILSTYLSIEIGSSLLSTTFLLMMLRFIQCV